MTFAAYMFVERGAPPSVIKGDHWRVSWFARELGQFIGGTGRSAWDALAWAIVDYEETKLGLVVTARNASESPYERLAHLRSGAVKPTRTAVYKLAPPTYAPKESAAARRAKTKTKAKKK